QLPEVAPFSQSSDRERDQNVTRPVERVADKAASFIHASSRTWEVRAPWTIAGTNPYSFQFTVTLSPPARGRRPKPAPPSPPKSRPPGDGRSTPPEPPRLCLRSPPRHSAGPSRRRPRRLPAPPPPRRLPGSVRGRSHPWCRPCPS